MFDLGWTELLVIGIVALIVVGPKDLPHLFRALGRFTGKARAMAREFSQAMNDAADQSGVSDIEKTFRAAANPKGFGMDKLREATGSVFSDDIPPSDPAAKARTDEIAADAAELEAEPEPEAAPEETQPETSPKDTA